MNRSLKVLVVEDEIMVAMLVEDMLHDLGHLPVGPAARLAAGIGLAETEQLDLAILDINLGNEKSFPIADILTRRGIPVIFATGYGAKGLDERFASFPVLTKPFEDSTFANAIVTALARRSLG